MNQVKREDILNLKKQGKTDREIACLLHLHPTTVGKLKKGIIQSSKTLGSKPRISEKKFTPIWEAIDDIYKLCNIVAYYECQKYSYKYKEELLEYLLDFSFTRPIEYIEKLKKMDSPSGYHKINLKFKAREFCELLAKRNKNVLFSVPHHIISQDDISLV